MNEEFFEFLHLEQLLVSSKHLQLSLIESFLVLLLVQLKSKRLVLHSDWLPNQMAQILPVFVSFDLTSFIIAFAICSFIGSQLQLSYPILPS